MLMKSEHRKELVSEIRSLAQSQGLNTVFTTFLEITANSLAAQTDPENAEKREQRYQEMASTMTPELLSSYARMLAFLFLTIREYRDDPCDILGGIYHELNLNNEWNGQYFTPDDVCRLMAQITLPSDELSANDGPITINEPTCGSGTVEEDPHENAAVVQSIELLQDQKKEQAKNIMAEITLCSLMGRTTSFARQLVAAVEEVMAPYSAEASEEYMEFADMTEELKSDYAKSIDCLKLPNGKIVECGSYPYFSKYSIVDGKVSQNKVGPLHHTRRTKQSRKIQYLPNCPRQKLYKTFEKYAGDYRGYEYNEEEKGYGFYCNPNAMWDWYQIGGRWPVSFLVKTDCTEYSFGERSWGNYSKKYPAPEGYMWVSAARKKDICWDVMQNWYTVQDTERYNKFKEAFQTGKLPDGYYGKIQENGIFYCGECTYAADETLDEYLARVGIPKSWKYPIGVSDIVDADEWLSKNDINIGKESNSWHEQIDTYIDDLDGEDVLVSVDYHI